MTFIDLDLAVVRDEEPIAILCAFDGAFHFTPLELPFWVGIPAQAPQDQVRRISEFTRWCNPAGFRLRPPRLCVR